MEQFIKEVLLCKNGDNLLCYNHGIILIKSYIDGHVKCKTRIGNVFAGNNTIARLLRFSPRAALSVGPDEFIFSFHGHIYNYTTGNHLTIEHDFLKGMNNPLSFCPRYDSTGALKDVLYGEYIWNDGTKPVSIFRRNQDGWREVYTFPKGEITHIHNIVYDKYLNRYLIMTGDQDSESGIWEADESFNSVKSLIKGSQKFRACILSPKLNRLYYVTDTPLEQNFVYCMEGNAVHQVAPIPGPCIFGIEKGDSLYFSTSVEGDPSLGKWKYRFCNKLGKGVHTYYSHLFRLWNDGQLEELYSIKKDKLPMWFFGFGNISFPTTDDDNVYFCPQSLILEPGTYLISK